MRFLIIIILALALACERDFTQTIQGAETGTREQLRAWVQANGSVSRLETILAGAETNGSAILAGAVVIEYKGDYDNDQGYDTPDLVEQLVVCKAGAPAGLEDYYDLDDDGQVAGDKDDLICLVWAVLTEVRDDYDFIHPTALFDLPENVEAGDTVVFVAESIDDRGLELTHRWIIAGIEKSGKLVSQVFEAPGTYRIALESADGFFTSRLDKELEVK